MPLLCVFQIFQNKKTFLSIYKRKNFISPPPTPTNLYSEEKKKKSLPKVEMPSCKFHEVIFLTMESRLGRSMMLILIAGICIG